MLTGNNEGEEQHDKILSIAQDIVYISSGGRTLTPKHVGLASTVHHATRNKSLIQLLHAAGHCSSYETVEVDTYIANSEVARWNENGKLVVPPNLTLQCLGFTVKVDCRVQKISVLFTFVLASCFTCLLEAV